MKTIIRLTESDLHRIIKDSVRRYINEGQINEANYGPEANAEIRSLKDKLIADYMKEKGIDKISNWKRSQFGGQALERWKETRRESNPQVPETDTDQIPQEPETPRILKGEYVEKEFERLGTIVPQLNNIGFECIMSYIDSLPVLLVYDNPDFVEAYSKDKTLGGILPEDMVSHWKSSISNDVYLSNIPYITEKWNEVDDILYDKKRSPTYMDFGHMDKRSKPNDGWFPTVNTRRNGGIQDGGYRADPNSGL